VIVLLDQFVLLLKTIVVIFKKIIVQNVLFYKCLIFEYSSLI